MRAVRRSMELPAASDKIRVFFLFLLLLFFSLRCQDLGVVSFDFERDAPQWLKAKIETMSTQRYYVGARVYRHEWKGGLCII